MEPYVRFIVNVNCGDERSIRFEMKNGSDFVVFREVFMSGVYRIIYKAPCAVVDIGMNIGLATLFLARNEYVKKVYGFEPFTQTYNQAEKNISLNDCEIKDKITLYNVALSNTNREATYLYEADNPGGMRIAKGSRTVGEEHPDAAPVKIRDAGETLLPIFNSCEDMNIILKSDCEGSEYDIFYSLEKKDLLKRIRCIMMETHDGRQSEIEAMLSDKGFVVFSEFIGGKYEIGMLYAVRV